MDLLRLRVKVLKLIGAWDGQQVGSLCSNAIEPVSERLNSQKGLCETRVA